MCFVFFLFRRRRKQRQNPHHATPSPAYETAGNTIHEADYKKEPVHEMYHNQGPADVVQRGPIELESRQR